MGDQTGDPAARGPFWAIRSRAQAERAAEGVTAAGLGLAFLFGLAAACEIWRSSRGLGAGPPIWAAHLAIAFTGGLVVVFCDRPRSLRLATAVLALAVGVTAYAVLHGYAKAFGWLAFILLCAIQGWRGVRALQDPALPLCRDHVGES
jgi:hypothetical protein